MLDSESTIGIDPKAMQSSQHVDDGAVRCNHVERHHSRTVFLHCSEVSRHPLDFIISRVVGCPVFRGKLRNGVCLPAQQAGTLWLDVMDMRHGMADAAISIWFDLYTQIEKRQRVCAAQAIEDVATRNGIDTAEDDVARCNCAGCVVVGQRRCISLYHCAKPERPDSVGQNFNFV